MDLMPYYSFCLLGVLFLLALIIASSKTCMQLYLLVPLAMAHLVGILSCGYIETGIFVLEQDRMSFPTGVTLRLIFMLSCFWGGVAVACNLKWFHVKERMSPTSLGIAVIGVVGCAALLFVLFANVAAGWPPPLLRPGYITRFDPMPETVLSPIINVLGKTLLIIPIVLGAVTAYEKNIAGTTAKLLFALYLLYALLIGQKFGGLAYALFLFALPIVYPSVSSLKLTRLPIASIGLKLAGCGLLVMALIYFHYARHPRSDEFGGPLGLIVYRIFGMQGHLTWGIDEYVFLNQASKLPIANIGHAMTTMIEIVSGTEVAEFTASRGSQFAFGFPIVLPLFFDIGTVALLLVLIGFAFGVIVVLLIRILPSNNVIVTSALIYFFFSYVTVVSQGSMEALTKPANVAVALVGIMAAVISMRPQRS
jgi:hypothetical protein